MRLAEKTALITGAASGIGLEIAKTFASEGARVGIADCNSEGAVRACSQLQAAGYQAWPLTMDVSAEDQVESAVEEVCNRFGRLDILVSNAGIQHIDPIDQLSFANWRKVIGVHLDGAFLTTRACLRRMYASESGGSIIYIGSVHSMLASPLKAPYVAAKHGILGLCRVVAKEGASRGVRAYVICPGFVRTPLVDKQIPEQAEKLKISEEDVIKKVMLKDTIDGEFTTTGDITEIALFLAAFPTAALSGQSFVVSHGWHMD